MRIYGKDIDIQGEGANANISLSFSRTNMFSFGMDIPKCQILEPPITPMADYCCKYPAVIAGGVGLPVMNVCVNAISKNSVNLCIETAANGDVPIYELFKDNIICGCCRPVTPAVTDALLDVGMCVEFIPQYSNVDACAYGGYAAGCLMHEPITWSQVCDGDFVLCRSCYGIVCPLELDLPSDYIYNICGARTCSGDPTASIRNKAIDVNDYTFVWQFNNFVECASCWWECNCGVPITGVPKLRDDYAIVFPNTRECYMCAPWSMTESVHDVCEWVPVCKVLTCWYDDAMPTGVNGFDVEAGSYRLEFHVGASPIFQDPSGYEFTCNLTLSVTDLCGCKLCYAYYVPSNSWTNKLLVRYNDAAMEDVINSMFVGCDIGYLCTSGQVIIPNVSPFVADSACKVPYGVVVCSDCLACGFTGKFCQGIIVRDYSTGDELWRCYASYNLSQKTICEYQYVGRTTEWSTRDPYTGDDSMCYGCVCLPWIGNFFGCGIIDTIRRVVTTLGCYMNGADVYSPSGKTFAINCALDYCVYNCSTFQTGYTTEPSECYISCNSGGEGVVPLLGVLQKVEQTQQFWQMCYPVIDPYTNSAQYIQVPFTFESLIPPHTGIKTFGWHAQLAGCCSLICPSCYNVPTYLCGCVGSINDYCCRTEVAIARMLYNVECGYVMPVVCGDYNKPYIAAQLCYEQRVHLDLNACYCYKWYDGGGCEHYTNIPWTMLTYDIMCGCENTAPIGCCGEIPMLRWLCQPSKTGVRNNAVTLTTQPSDTNTILSNGVGSCFVWNGARYRIERIDNYNPTAATCLKVFGVMV